MRIRTADGKATLPATFGLICALGRENGPGVDDNRRWLYLAPDSQLPDGSDSALWMALESGAIMHWSNKMAANQFVAVDHVGEGERDAQRRAIVGHSGVNTFLDSMVYEEIP